MPSPIQAVSTLMSACQDGDGDATYRKSETVVSETLDGELVLLCLDSGVYYGLDRIGTFIWTSLSGGNTVNATLTALAQQFPSTERSLLQQDLMRLLRELTEAKLLCEHR